MAHPDGQQRLVLVDGSNTSESYSSTVYHTIRWQATRHRIDEEHVHEFEPIDQLISDERRILDYDFGRLRADLSTRGPNPRETAHPMHNLYEHPGDHSQPATDSDPQDEGRSITRIRIEEARQHGLRSKGNDDLRVMVPGCTFHLVGFLEQKANREYFIFSIKFRIEGTGETTGTGQQWRCGMELKIQPTNEIFRPVRTQHKPRTSGPVRACVVGPVRHPIHTDQYGRAKVQIPYDLYSNNDEHSSYWVRVANTWAGNRLGVMYLSRVGQEALVTGIHGNPDCLVATECVYNKMNLSPWVPP